MNRNKQKGTVLILTAFAIVVLVGFLGLAVDASKLMVNKTERQSALDACALAASQELNGDSDSLTRAINAGITVGNKNKDGFQETSAGIVSSDIEFSETLNPFNSGASASTAKYVKCEKDKTGIASWFMQVLGVASSDISARAVASNLPSQSACVLPIGFCTNGVVPPASCPGGGVPDKYGLCVGDWRNGKFSAGEGDNGVFNWLQLPDQANGTPGVVDALMGNGSCSVATGPVDAKTGNLGNAAAKAWNSRFGEYENGNGNPQLSTAPPDFTGYTYTNTATGIAAWPTQRNAYPDFANKRASNTSYQGDNNTGLTLPGGYNNTTSANHQTYGSNRRLVVIPMIDCSKWVSHKNTIQDFACVLLLHPIDTSDGVTMEYRGLANLPGSPCTAYGLSGGGAATGPKVSTLVQ